MDYHPDSLILIPGWCPFYFSPDEPVGHAYVHFDIPSHCSETTRRYFPKPVYIPEASLVGQFGISPKAVCNLLNLLVGAGRGHYRTRPRPSHKCPSQQA